MRSRRPPARLRVLTWNVQFRRPESPVGARIRARLAALSPDIAVLTETAGGAYLEGGHLVESDSDYGYGAPPYRRKVTMWSARGWTEVDTTGDASLPAGRFVSAITETDLGPVRVVGVCIPWSAAHVSTGGKDRRPWQDHTSYLEGLRGILDRPARDDLPVIVAGDFNQRLPRSRQPTRVFEALTTALGNLEVATQGTPQELDRQLIDHIAVGPELECTSVVAFSRLDEDGSQLSDHDGVWCELVLAKT